MKPPTAEHQIRVVKNPDKSTATFSPWVIEISKSVLGKLTWRAYDFFKTRSGAKSMAIGVAKERGLEIVKGAKP